MNTVIPTTTVYCYYFPEVRETISRIGAEYPHETFLRSVSPGLDDFHVPIVEKYARRFSNYLPNLAQLFPHHYTTSGASEGIFHILARIASHEKGTPLYVFEGEYEGYEGYGKNLGLSFEKVLFEADARALPAGIFFISNPSAINGMILSDNIISRIGDAGHRIIYDATYVGLTREHAFDISHPAIETVIVSLSKPYGLYYYRLGFCFSKREYPTLAVNKWFKNIHTHIIAGAIFESYDPSYFVRAYGSWQSRAVKELSANLNIHARASDVLLLARASRLDAEKSKDLGRFARGDGHRFCLTPYFLNYEKSSLL